MAQTPHAPRKNTEGQAPRRNLAPGKQQVEEALRASRTEHPDTDEDSSHNTDDENAEETDGDEDSREDAFHPSRKGNARKAGRAREKAGASTGTGNEDMTNSLSEPSEHVSPRTESLPTVDGVAPALSGGDFQSSSTPRTDAWTDVTASTPSHGDSPRTEELMRRSTPPEIPKKRLSDVEEAEVPLKRSKSVPPGPVSRMSLPRSKSLIPMQESGTTIANAEEREEKEKQQEKVEEKLESKENMPAEMPASSFLDFDTMPGSPIQAFDTIGLIGEYESLQEEYNMQMKGVIDEWQNMNEKIEMWIIRGTQMQIRRETCMLQRNVQQVDEKVRQASKQREELVGFCRQMQKAFSMFFPELV